MPTKLGPHVIKAAPDLSEYILAGIAVAKFAGSWGTAQSVPDGVLVIGRLVVDEQDYTAQKQKNKWGQTPLEAVQKFLEDQLPTYQANPHIKYWEGHNEPVWDSEEDMAWYAQFEVERMRRMADLGLKCVIGNFSTGTPKLELWPAFLPALQAARQHQALLGLHEYSWPWVWWMAGKHQPESKPDEGDEGWLTLRYRKVYRQYLDPNGLGDVPLVITECGLDPGVGPKPAEAKDLTWDGLGNFWNQKNHKPDRAEYYFEQLCWYDEELQKDDYVVGATIYTWGSFPGTYVAFDVAGTEVAKKLITYAKADPARSFEYLREKAGSTRHIVVRIPTARDQLVALGLPEEDVQRGLALLAQARGPVEQLVPGEYAIELPVEAPPERYTNQQVITAIYRAAEAVGEDGWALLSRAGLTHLVQDRHAPYEGLPIAELPGLTPEEKARVLADLAGQPVLVELEPLPKGESPYIFGLHDRGGQYLMAEAGRKGWVLVTKKLGHISTDLDGESYESLADEGFGVMVRLNNAYSPDGTLPHSNHYQAFAQRCANFVNASPGCHIWIIGNEMNMGKERPGGLTGQKITPELYAQCYRLCRHRIQALGGHERDQVVVGAVAPWNDQTKYPGNPDGFWIKYFQDILAELGDECDGLALHTYTHRVKDGDNLITDETQSWPQFPGAHSNFQTYRDFMAAIPPGLRHLPVYITETNQDKDELKPEDTWFPENRGWVREAYAEINEWNSTPGNQKIRCLLLYRWKADDYWGLEDNSKPGVIEDFKQALQNDYRWR